MASSSSSLVLLASLSLSSFMFLTVSQADLISTLCSKTQNPRLCNRILRSDQRSQGADLRGLGQIVIDRARPAVRVAIATLKSAGNNEASTTCTEVLAEALDILGQCRAYLKSLNATAVEDLRLQSSAAETNVLTCDDEFGGGEPAGVKTANKRAQDIISVLIAIGDSLWGGNLRKT